MTKSVALMASMAALGNVLAFISMYVGRFHPQVALDFSHLATAIVAVYLGPTLGMFTGALVGLAPYYYFGVLGWLGPFLGFVGFFIGKALSGLFFGLLGKSFRPLVAVVLGYIPECLWTYVVLRLLTRLMLPTQIAAGFTDAVVMMILLKAWFEIVIIGVIVDLVKRRRIVDAILEPTTAR
ncbi:hypothetical protein KEJ39_01795 [Candidatus Bathyarchaeota archaeon]|nr:hypothetical protein [Candidatus Bathyarchaeota archaeon]